MDLIAGCGYVGQRLARALGADQVIGLVRSRASALTLERRGLQSLRLDLDGDAAIRLPDDVSRVFYLLPPPPRGDTDPRMRRFLQAAAAAPPGRILYISTTGVYGDCQGDWIDETRPLQPGAARSHRRADAERQLQQFSDAHGTQILVLRVAGIYGPGKLPLTRLAQRQPMIAAGDAPWTNRIHVDDLVQTCVAAMNRCQQSTVFNVADGHPGKMTDYFNAVADLAGLPRPPIIAPEQAAESLSEGMRSYLRESRRIDNRKMLRELGITLRYPTLAEGLDNCGL